MLTKALVGLAVVLVVAACGMAVLLVPAHVDVRRDHPALPALAELQAAADSAGDRPVRLRWINTASQALDRSAVLGSGDPHPERPYRLSHSAFAVEWADGRILLVDAGMTRAQALEFGRMGEWIGGEPIEVHSSVGEALAADAARVGAVIFTHLHVDHVEGVEELCAAADRAPIAAFMNRAQLHRTNFTTADVHASLEELACLRRVDIGAAGLLRLEAFPGVFAVPVGGHTPGSQVVVVALQQGGRHRLAVITGDVVNNLDGIHFDVGKPALYRAFIVPEDDARLSEVRRWLRDLYRLGHVQLLVSHDELSLAASGIERFAMPGVVSAGD